MDLKYLSKAPPNLTIKDAKKFDALDAFDRP